MNFTINQEVESYIVKYVYLYINNKHHITKYRRVYKVMLLLLFELHKLRYIQVQNVFEIQFIVTYKNI